MPYLQLDVNGRYPTAQKQLLAQRMAEDYAAMMTVDARRISVAIRECSGDESTGGVWRFVDGTMVPSSVIMLDIRRGRSAELRMEVAKKMIAHCVEILGLSPDRVNVEFTQHDGDEMYHPTLGGYSPDWKKDEV
jgi:phenylpyruvate tautomerase PptA (4-oxalocrotonate tautomerase family)